MRAAGPLDAETMHALMRRAFAAYATLDPPSGALHETVDVVRDALTVNPGLIASVDGIPVGGLRIEMHDDVPHVRRVAVDPEHQGRGVCRAMMAWFEQWACAQGATRVGLGVRTQLPDNLALYQHLGYTLVAEHPHPETGRLLWFELAKDLAPTL